MRFEIRDGRPILVLVRCKVDGCGRELTYLYLGDAPTSETVWRVGTVVVKTCLRHGQDNAHGSVRAWTGRARRAGRTTKKIRVAKRIKWAELREAVDTATSTGRTTTYSI